MNHQAPIIHQVQLHLDQRLFEALRYLRVVDSQYEFSRMTGRHRSYFSSLKCKGLPMSAAALAGIKKRLSVLAAQEADLNRQHQLVRVVADLEDEIRQRLV